jgi:plasmid stability protein
MLSDIVRLLTLKTRCPVATLTIRNLDVQIKERLRVRAALHGRSMEEEARHILRNVVGGGTGPALWERSRSLFAGEKGIELDFPARGEDRAPPTFD